MTKEYLENQFKNYHEITGDVVTPQMFGAVGDGVTDDTNAIITAETVANTSFKVLYFPSGTYKVQAGAITCHSGMTWIGEEKKSIIIVDQTATDTDKAIVKIGTVNVADSGNDVAIIGLTFRGSETHGDDQSGISLMDISYSKNILIKNCVFQNNKYTAIRLIRTSNIKIFDCDFEATDCGVVSLGSYPSNDVVIKRCHFTGLSSLNSFTNYSSECVTVGNNAQSDACERWTIEDCIFEHKHTNGISFTTSESPLTNKIHTKDSVIRNCTFRGMLGAVYIGNSENISVDGIFVDDTPKEFAVSEMHRVINIEYSKHITVRNVTSKCTELYQSVIKLHSGDDDILIDGIDAYNVHRSSNEAFAYLSGNNITIKNVVIHPVSTFTTAYISCLALTNSYVDISGNVAEGLVTKYWRNSASSTVTNNTFIVHTEDATNRTWEGTSTSVADTNKWILVGDGEKDVTNLSQVNQYSIPKTLVVSPTNSSQLDTIGSLTDFTLMQEGYEFFIAFKSSTYANGKSASFNKTGNIIPIDKPLVFSNDYKVVCHFVQKNAKWVEVKRTLEYYESANIDAGGSYEIRHRYNVLNYGLVPNNASIDNSIALTSMMADIPEGAIIYFPQGYYRFATSIEINKNLAFVGDNDFDHVNTTASSNHSQTEIEFGGALENTTFIEITDGNVSFEGISFYCKNGYSISDNTAAFSQFPYPLIVSTTTRENVNCIDVQIKKDFAIRNCTFQGFSGYALQINDFTFVRFCNFNSCKIGVQVAGTDDWIQNCSFVGCGICVKSVPNARWGFLNLAMSDTWADQVEEYVFTSTLPSASQIKLFFDNLWVDEVNRAAIYLPDQYMSCSHISGRFSRCGMSYAEDVAQSRIPTRDATSQDGLDAIVIKRINSCEFDIQIDRRIIGKGENANGVCCAYGISSLSSANANNRIRIYDTEVERAVYSPNVFSNTTIEGSDKTVLTDSIWMYDYSPVLFRNSSPVSRVTPKRAGMLTCDYSAIGGLYRSTGTTNADWEIIAAKPSNGKELVAKWNVFPTANADRLGWTIMYMGATDLSTQKIHGATYECVSDGAATPTYSWVAISVPMEGWKAIVSQCNDFADFKTLIENF